jgi:hypothetical protein
MTDRESRDGGQDRGPGARLATPGDERASAQDRPSRAHRQRPPAVTVVAVTYLVMSVAWAALAIRALISAQILLPPGGGILDMESLRSSLTLNVGIVTVRQVFVGVTAWMASIALLRMHPRGWLLGMIAAVVVLAVQLVSWYDATPNYVLMTLAVAIVLLMNQVEVRDAFGEEANTWAT